MILVRGCTVTLPVSKYVCWCTSLYLSKASLKAIRVLSLTIHVGYGSHIELHVQPIASKVIRVHSPLYMQCIPVECLSCIGYARMW